MRINSIYSTLTHQPLVLLQQDISYSQFLALMSVAEVFMATNLREGMNLTSHDFIHCQDGQVATQKHGSLILSEFTGSASIFQGHELIVNPWDYKQCAEAINTALEMSPERRQRNWQFLLERKSPHTALAWYSSLQSALAEAHSMQQSHDTQTIAPLSIENLRQFYYRSQNCLFFLEDGATIHTDLSDPSREASDILQVLTSNSKNTVYLTSNRSPDQIDKAAYALPAPLGFVAENGCFIKPLDATAWNTLVDVDSTRDWRAGIRKVMEYYADRTDGSTIEERRCSLTFHYDKALDANVAAHQASELADQISGARGSEAIRVVRDITAVSVEPLYASKAAAADNIMARICAEKTPDLVFVAGGARSDEALFRWANRLALSRTPSNEAVTSHAGSTPCHQAIITLTAGTHATEARAVLPAGWSLLDVLRALATTPMDEQTE